MEFVRLGTSTLEVSRVGFGCAAMGGYDYGVVHDQESRAAVWRALDLGINFFDTADVYGFGHAEEILAEALGPKIREVVVATKFGVSWDAQKRMRRDTSALRLEQALDASLKRLRVDHIPLYQVHWPDGATPWSETLHALECAQKAGKIGLMGLCNVEAEDFDVAQARARVETLQLPFGLLHPEREGELREARQKHGVGLLTYNSLGQGLLTGRYDSTSEFTGTDLRARTEGFSGPAMLRKLDVTRRVRDVGERYGKSPAQVALRWVMQRLSGTVVLAGMKTPSQAEDNAGAVGWTLADDDMEALSAEPQTVR